jgi:hypothetical protein
MSHADPLELLSASPSDEYALFEFAVEWEQAFDATAQLAAALRLFVITRDPLDWLAHRGSVWATANGDGDALELPVYMTREELDRRLAAGDGDLAAAVGPLAWSVVTAAAAIQGIVFAGAYPELAFRGEVPSLLAQLPDDADGPLSLPAVEARSQGWEPLGLGAIQDLVQEAFGPVRLDRSQVALRPVEPPQKGCPACMGVRFGFPGDLAEAQHAMCPEHSAQADAETSYRIERARASNPAGWRAIGKASARTSGLPEPADAPAPQRRASAPGRNDPCPCGSGRKYKQCCGR